MGNLEARDRPEREIALRAILAGCVVAVAAFGAGFLINGLNAAVSALLGVVVVAGTFAGYVVVLGWARSISPTALQVAALGGWLIRLSIFVGVLVALRPLDWFDVAGFGFAGLVAAGAVAIYEAKFILGDAAARTIPRSPNPNPSGRAEGGP